MKPRLFGLAAALALILLAGAAVVLAAPLRRSEPPNLGDAYVGSRRCLTCHNTPGARLWDAWADTIHGQTVQPATPDNLLGDLENTDALTVDWPDGTTRPITAGDITYVINGRHIQQYISVRPREDGSEGWYVLPVVWNRPMSADQVGEWTPFQPDVWTDPAYDWRVTCAGCHTTGLTRAIADGGYGRFMLLEDFDGRRRGAVELGIGCEACHGPAGDHDGGRNPLVASPDAQVCGQCHAQGHTPAGNHATPLEYEPGMTLDESLFVNVPPDDESVWWPTGHTRVIANQYPEWITSAHAAALDPLQGSADADDSCLRCHSAGVDTTDPTPDRAVTLAEAQFGVTCAACHNVHAAESDPRFFDLEDTPLAQAEPDKLPDALLRPVHPPLAIPAAQGGEGDPLPYLLQAESYALCTSCHNSRTAEGGPLLVSGALHYPVQEMFEGWDVVEGLPGIPSAHAAAEDGPRCVTCHMPRVITVGPLATAGSHTFRPVLPGEAADIQPDSCTGCHADLVTRAAVQQLIGDTQAATAARVQAAREAAGPDAADWVETVLQFVEGDGSRGVHNFRYADVLLDALEAELGLAPTPAPPPSTGPYLGDAAE